MRPRLYTLDMIYRGYVKSWRSGGGDGVFLGDEIGTKTGGSPLLDTIRM